MLMWSILLNLQKVQRGPGKPLCPHWSQKGWRGARWLTINQILAAVLSSRLIRPILVLMKSLMILQLQKVLKNVSGIICHQLNKALELCWWILLMMLRKHSSRRYVLITQAFYKCFGKLMGNFFLTVLLETWSLPFDCIDIRLSTLDFCCWQKKRGLFEAFYFFIVIG